MSQKEKAIAFQALHAKPGIFVIPNPWDAGSARLLEHLGFAALATTSAGFAFSMARPDGAMSRDETLANAQAIVNATALPVSADLEGGFGPSPRDCAETIALAAGVGLVGGSIEDATGDKGNPIFSLEAAAERVRAAAETARALAFPFMLTARAENFLHGRPDIKDTVKRLQAFQQAGADVLYAPGLATVDDIRAVTSSVDRPVNFLMAGGLSVAELAKFGVKRVSVGGSLARAALGALLGGGREMRERGTFAFADEAPSYGELTNIFSPRG
ncbi:MAG: isocitrate lyase/phosphoenolpyruvate mutase family protein [Rhizobiales bacterium]|nr:isocitrate lyase/phosphoenolpyruvate mutase family protein [Hyphomicrobiales bacterium]